MPNDRCLLIDGAEVTFVVEISEQTVPPGSKTDSEAPFLGARARQGGTDVWHGVVSSAVHPLVPIREQFSDYELERLYRRARGVSRWPCPVCGTPSDGGEAVGDDILFLCPSCGAYRLSGSALEEFRTGRLKRPDPAAFRALVQSKRGDAAAQPTITAHDIRGVL